MSADNTVDDPADLQDWNPYSYVSNRPLSLSDPTGHFPLGLPGVGGGGPFVYQTNAINPNDADSESLIVDLKKLVDPSKNRKWWSPVLPNSNSRLFANEGDREIYQTVDADQSDAGDDLSKIKPNSPFALPLETVVVNCNCSPDSAALITGFYGQDPVSILGPRVDREFFIHEFWKFDSWGEDTTRLEPHFLWGPVGPRCAGCHEGDESKTGHTATWGDYWKDLKRTLHGLKTEKNARTRESSAPR